MSTIENKIKFRFVWPKLIIVYQSQTWEVKEVNVEHVVLVNLETEENLSLFGNFLDDLVEIAE